MEPLLTDDQAQVQAAISRIIAEMAGPARLRALRGSPHGLDEVAWAELCAAQWPLLLAPAEAGGQGLGAIELALLAEAAGEHLLQAPLIESVVGLDLFARLTGRLPEPSLTLDPGLVLWTSRRPNHHSERSLGYPAAQQTTEGWRLGGAAIRLPRGSSARARYVFPAHTHDGQILLLIEPGMCAERIQTGFDIDGVRADTLDVEGLYLPTSALLACGSAAESAYARANDLLLLGTSAALAGVALAAHRITLDHLRTRRQFGRALSNFQALQHRCVDAFIDLELNRSLLYRVAQTLDLGQATGPMMAALKGRTSRAGLAITRLALQMHGAAGYADQHDIGLFHRRALCLAASCGGEAFQINRFCEATWTMEAPI